MDFVIASGRRLLAVEVKSAERPSYQAARNVLNFREICGRNFHGALLLHTGGEVAALDQDALAAP